MQGGDDVAFVNVRWLGHSRGAIIDTSSVLLRNTRVDRLPPPAALRAASANQEEETPAAESDGAYDYS